MRFQPLTARLALIALGLGVAIAALAIGAVRAGLMDFDRARQVMIPAVAFGIAGLGLALAWMVSALRRNKAEEKRAGLAALLGSLLFLWPPLHAQYNAITSPAIHDVSSDPDDPPSFIALLKERGPHDNAPAFDNRTLSYRGETGNVSYILHTFYGPNSGNPFTKPLALIMPQHRMFWRCFETAKKMGWRLVAWDEKSGRIEAAATSFWFGQVSDISIRVRPAGSRGARFDIRAQKRSGDVDYGRNIALIKAYRSRLNAH